MKRKLWIKTLSGHKDNKKQREWTGNEKNQIAGSF
jgi:hypothetical protein